MAKKIYVGNLSFAATDDDPEGKTIIAETEDADPAEEGDKNFGNKSLWKRC